MSTVIVSGGKIHKEFALAFLRRKVWNRMIAVDKGAEFFYDNGMHPTDMVGDFDSLKPSIKCLIEGEKSINIHAFSPQKDASDTEMAVRLACETEKEEIIILGATGTRIDHMLGNIQVMTVALELGILCSIYDEYNKITLHRKSFSIKREEQYGKFVSFFSLGKNVEKLSLKGFAYPLKEYTVSADNSLCISNEITEEIAEVSFAEGTLVMIESKD